MINDLFCRPLSSYQLDWQSLVIFGSVIILPIPDFMQQCLSRVSQPTSQSQVASYLCWQIVYVSYVEIATHIHCRCLYSLSYEVWGCVFGVT